MSDSFSFLEGLAILFYYLVTNFSIVEGTWLAFKDGRYAISIFLGQHVSLRSLLLQHECYIVDNSEEKSSSCKLSK
jgi:hypothetical protein